MQIKNIVWNVQQLDHDMKQLQKALATSVLLGSPQYVIDGLKKDYKKAFNQYHNYMDLDVKDVILEDRSEEVVVKGLKLTNENIRELEERSKNPQYKGLRL